MGIVTNNLDPSIAKAEAFLKRCEFDCEREPFWVKEGQKPDFFCTGKKSLWVEVKTLGDTPLDEKRAHLWKSLKHRESSVSAKGSAYASASEYATEKDIKVALKLAEILITEWKERKQTWGHAFSLIPFDPIYENNIKLTFESDEGPVTVLSCESETGKYELPSLIKPKSYEEIVSLSNKEGEKIRDVPFYELEESGMALISLELYPDAETFEIKSLMVGGDFGVRNILRIRDSVKKARRQLNNGKKYKEAPSLVLIFQDGLLVPSDILIPSAFYGDLTYSFPRGALEKGDYYYGRNGVFGPDKNRSISAVSLIRNNTMPFTVHNYWAYHLLPPGLLGGKEVSCNNEGRFEVKDY